MNSSKVRPDLLKTRQHFEILDGLRGVAALAIVIFHFMEEVILDYSKILSGMVIWLSISSFVYQDL